MVLFNMDLSHLQILFLLLVFEFDTNVASDPEPLVSNKSFFNLKSKANEPSEDGEHSRVKREDVSQIKHLHNTERINEHSQEEKDAILAKHIYFRSRANPEASNMEYMTWNDDLAELAGLWASVCYWGHGLTDHTDLINSFDDGIGQNLWLGGGKPNGEGAVVSWHDNEINNYIYEDGTCKSGRVCGHYTQVVWANSKEVGCSRAFCQELIDINGDLDGRTNLWIEACHYAPPGNYNGVKPFKSGPSCTECASGSAYCTDNACKPCDAQDDSCDCRQVCHNCGTLTSECKCSCMDGWYGASCSTKCEDTHSNCWKSPGWPSPAYCGSHEAIPKGCPLMCGVCVEEDEKCVTTEAPKVTNVRTTSSPTTPLAATMKTQSSTTPQTKTTMTSSSNIPEVTTKKPSAVSDVTTKKTQSECTKTCQNNGELQKPLQKDCNCKCQKENTGDLCEKEVEEVESGVEILFAESISDYTEEFETKLRETVATVVTIYCNDNLEECCEGTNSDTYNANKGSQTFDFVSYEDVVTGQGYPVSDPEQENAFWTMLVIKVPESTDLCENGIQTANNRRKRDLTLILSRNRRVAEGVSFLDQDILLKVISENQDTIENDLDVTISSVKQAEITTTTVKKGTHPGIIAAAIIATLLAVVIITVIVILIFKRFNSQKNKTEDNKWANKDNGADKPALGGAENQRNNGNI